MDVRSGISPVLATVIIIAVTLVIAIGVIGWIMGIWGSFGTTESLQILPDSKLYSNGTIKIHVKNTGSATAIVTGAEVVGVGEVTISSQDTTIAPGENIIISGTVDGQITAGARYTIKIYTDAGNVYSTNIIAEEAP